MPNFNCTCEDDWPQRTLSSLRTELLRRLGFSAQAANPPPGMAELLTSFLQDAQEQLYRRYDALRTERFYRWETTEGEKFYDIQSNDDASGTGACTKYLDPYKVRWVGMEDSNGAWWPLIKGIPPELYTITTNSRPTHYEIRQCIEIFPPPDDLGYTLRVKGHFGLEDFDEDDDTTTIDPHAVFLLALAQAKAHHGHPDASNYFAQSTNYIGSLVAGSHGTARYVPGSAKPMPVPRPVFLPVSE